MHRPMWEKGGIIYALHRSIQGTPHYGMRSDSYPHKWGTCRPVISAGEKPGNHFPLLFRALYTAGNRGNVQTLSEYDRVSNPQDFATPA